MSGWTKVRRKVQQGKDFRGEVHIAIEDETATLEHRLLSEGEVLKLMTQMDLDALSEYKDSEESEAEKRLKELQGKDDLTDAEETELQNLTREVTARQFEIMSELGEETFEAFMAAGKAGIVPSDEDVSEAWNADVSEQRERFGAVPNTRAEVEDLLTEEMNEVLTDNPYPVKFLVGQQVFAESTQALGNLDLKKST